VDLVQKWSWMGLLSAAGLFLSVALLASGNGGRGTPDKRPAKPKVVRPKVGQLVPDFTLPDVKGKKVRLSDFKGKKIFVLELGACT